MIWSNLELFSDCFSMVFGLVVLQICDFLEFFDLESGLKILKWSVVGEKIDRISSVHRVSEALPIAFS